MMTTRILAAGVASVLLLAGVAPAQQQIYWAGHYTGIWRADTTGANPEQILEGSVDIHYRGLAANIPGGKLYYTYRDKTSGSVGGIYRCDWDGSGVEEIISDASRAADVAYEAVGDKIYWTDHVWGGAPGYIRRANPDGSDVETVLTFQTVTPGFIDVDPIHGKIYWNDYDNGLIRRANLDGTGEETVLSGLDNPRHITLDLSAGKLYFSQLPETSDMVIGRANLDGSSLETLVEHSIGYGPGGIALDTASDLLYWHDITGVYRAHLDGSDIQLLTTEGTLRYAGDIVIVPEPAAMCLLASGALAVIRKRRS